MVSKPGNMQQVGLWAVAELMIQRDAQKQRAGSPAFGIAFVPEFMLVDFLSQTCSSKHAMLIMSGFKSTTSLLSSSFRLVGPLSLEKSALAP